MKDRVNKFIISGILFLSGTAALGLGMTMVKIPPAAKIEVTGEPIILSEEELSGIGKININTAPKEELELLPEVGPATADKIIEYRTSRGGFKTIEEITKVGGIGPKTFEKIKKYLEI